MGLGAPCSDRHFPFGMTFLTNLVASFLKELYPLDDMNDSVGYVSFMISLVLERWFDVTGPKLCPQITPRHKSQVYERENETNERKT